MILRKNAPNVVRFHVNFSAREAKALFGRGFRWKKYRFSYRFARWRRDSGRERSKAVLGIQAVHTLGPGPIRTVRTAKDPAQSRPGTSTQWASGAGVQTSGFTSSESLYLRFNRRLIGFGRRDIEALLFWPRASPRSHGRVARQVRLPKTLGSSVASTVKPF